MSLLASLDDRSLSINGSGVLENNLNERESID
jgi:hypothetical protein